MTDYQNNDPIISSPLSRLRGIIRRYVVIESALAVGLFLALWFWLTMLIDYGTFRLFTFDWVLEAPKAMRAIALIAGISLLLALVITKMIIRLTRDFSQSSLALILEKRFPAILGDRLITAVQLSDMDKAKAYGYSTQMIEKTVADVRNRMNEIPVEQAFNWKRLRRQAGLLGLVTFGFFVLSAGVVSAITKQSPIVFLRDFTRTSTILAERDLFLMNTPWPRRAYIELVDFPGEELRIVRGQDVKVRVAAYQWVWADQASAVGWRPLTWADLPNALPGETIPKLPLQSLRDSRFAVDYGPFVFGAGHPFRAPVLPFDVTDVPEEPAKWSVDRVIQVFQQNDDVKTLLADKFSSDLAAIEQTLTKLTDRANQSGMSRTLKKLDIPQNIEIRGWGLKTNFDRNFRPEPGQEINVYNVVLTSGTKEKGKERDITESVKFYVRGDNFTTLTKSITLVPPPALQELYRDEYQPAYLYHRSPFVEEKDLDKDQKPYLAEPKLLKGLKQIIPDQPISLTGDRSRFDIPMGTDFTIKGKSDKPLIEAKLLPKPGKFPGIEAENLEPEPITLKVIDNHRFEAEFSAAKNMAVTRQTEFDIFLKDTDNVTSKRSVQIVVKEDRPPDVNVEVDIIRKVDGVYLCTPQALIPFKPGSGATPGSTITDDNGLNRIDYVFSYYEIEPAAITQKRAEFAAWYWAKSPIFPTIGDAIFRGAVHTTNYDKIKSDKAVIDTFTPVKAFIEDYTNRSRIQTLAQIKDQLNKARPPATELRVINRLDYRSSESEPKYADEEKEEPKYSFDLKRSVPGLRRESETDIQRNYLLTLNVIAVDTNVDAAKPGISQNKETLVFRLVSDAELLSRIAMDEAKLAEELEDVIKKVSELETKFRSFSARVPSLQNADAFISEQSATNDMAELLANAKNKTSEVNAKYNAILLEYKTNRMEKNLIAATKSKIVDKLGEVLDRNFNDTEKDYSGVQTLITQNRQPEAAQIFATQQKITVLLDKLREIRGGIGQGLDLKKVITDAEELLKRIRVNKQYIDEWVKQETNLIEAINLRLPNAPLSVSAGQKITVKIPLVIGPAYSENFLIKLEPSVGSDLKVPEKITLKDGDRELTLEVTAGNNKGTFAIRMIPDVGPVKDLKVIVK